MIPTLLIGDFILVNKYAYGLRLPVLHKKILDIGEPERGDVIVFRYPVDTSVSFIKRLVGLPGDTVTYRDKQLFINGELVEMEELGRYTSQDVKCATPRKDAVRFAESLGSANHDVLLHEDVRCKGMASGLCPKVTILRWVIIGIAATTAGNGVSFLKKI